jgi:hypothetical protein
MSNQFRYAVDIVLVIDATGSMSPVIETVKRAALGFDADLRAAMDAKERPVDTLRVRVVVFRDFAADHQQAFEESPFFSLPAERDAFAEFVGKIRAMGGGDAPENGLEGVAQAIRSEWTTEGDKRRHIIVVWTDTSAHKLESRVGGTSRLYPPGLPGSLAELTDWWEGQEHMNQNAKRLLIYAPDAYPWTDMYNSWLQTILVTSRAGEGLKEHDYAEIIDSIANSI